MTLGITNEKELMKDRLDELEKRVSTLDKFVHEITNSIKLSKENIDAHQDIYYNKNKMPNLNMFLAYIFINFKPNFGLTHTSGKFLLTTKSEIKCETFIPTSWSTNMAGFTIDGCVDIDTLHSTPEVYKITFYQVVSEQTILDINESFRKLNKLIMEMMECGNELSKESLYWENTNEFYKLEFSNNRKDNEIVADLNLMHFNDNEIEDTENISSYVCNGINVEIKKSDREFNLKL